ncbi:MULTISPECIES: hypothetical protein [Paenarthrobacter]|uniref:DUF4381 domain-containing protein n=1 Tax=Paenarthrobacter ureafaciens TaxID=37931 RepID=A0AAX3EML6_PAEUR|nr:MULTISPECIES: hypothetical protein [Paenarthrobacter]NKR12416.1 hypothetical protein [Arthrobacter sp. M5]NKR14247.1 hypothetical protein [Arthrobacter sp. M6]OEH61310.1 hypothetical protein A5N17_14460 [Arthrobacter sp. D2]OEH64260.1 hypothetical protein A5N13_12730 [Arthrobacter sp. D4]MDO5863345.1 hypothetical protein [Paenarthrobacter sp. SD-2]
MDEQQIQQIVDRVVAAIEGLKPGPAQDWQVWGAFGSYATLLAAVVAFLIGWWSIRQKREADARSEWWRRTQWALEASASDNDEMYSYGTGMLDLLARSELATPKDKELLDAVWEVTDTEMQDDSIEQLINEASKLNGLNEEEKAIVRSFYNVDDPPVTGENEDKNHSRNQREEADGSADR